MYMHRHGGDVYSEPYEVDFSANINPFGMPQSVKDAAWEGILSSVNYPDVSCRQLKKKISEKKNIPSEYFIFGNGAAELIFAVTSALKPKKVLVVSPGFAEYEQAARAFGCEIEHYFLKEKDQFLLENSYLESIREDIEMVFLCNPNNPTGQLIESDILLKILEKCKKYGVFVVLDECFNEFLDDPEQYTMISKIKEFKNMMILKAFTKIYAMPGLRLGYAICSDHAVIEKMETMIQPWNVSVPAQMAGNAALEEDEFVKMTRIFITGERLWMKKEIEKIGFKTFDSKANYLFFKGPENLAQHCKKYGILIRDCSNYEGLSNGYYRVAVRRREENEKLISCLKKAVEK